MKNLTNHFVDSHSIKTPYNVNDFEQDVLKLLPNLFKKNPIVILTGGSGLYIDAICDGFDNDLPQGNETIRKQLEDLYHKYGIEILQEKLKQLDPIFYQEIDLSNLKRLYRAIEVCMLSGKTYSELRQGIKQKRSFKIIKIALNRDKEELFDRINLRVDLMLQDGLLKEVESICQYRNENALKTVGYRELFDFLDKKVSLEEAIDKIKVNTRRYAKKQIAWFNRNNDYNWFHPNEKELIINYIETQLKS
jgi:tRNA dimethylallyltransferase